MFFLLFIDVPYLNVALGILTLVWLLAALTGRGRKYCKKCHWMGVL
jgi:hypothetical protein